MHTLAGVDAILDAASVVFSAGKRTKKAWLVGQLERQTRNPKTKSRAKNCTVRFTRFEKSNWRWLFKVSCRESYSAPYHTVRFRVVSGRGQQPNKLTSRSNVEVSCSCPAWLYWGSQYRATQKKYNDGRPENRAPNIRDPQGLNYLCKHVIAAIPEFLGYTVPIPQETSSEDDIEVNV